MSVNANVLKDNLLSKIQQERQWILEDIAFKQEQLKILDRMENELDETQLKLLFGEGPRMSHEEIIRHMRGLE